MGNHYTPVLMERVMWCCQVGVELAFRQRWEPVLFRYFGWYSQCLDSRALGKHKCRGSDDVAFEHSRPPETFPLRMYYGSHEYALIRLGDPDNTLPRPRRCSKQSHESLELPHHPSCSRSLHETAK